MGTVRAHPLYLGYLSGITAGAWLFCPKMYIVVPVMSVKALLVGTRYYLSGDPLASRVGQSFVVTVGRDGCSAGMQSLEHVC